jgi:hypothetical protein
MKLIVIILIYFLFKEKIDGFFCPYFQSFMKCGIDGRYRNRKNLSNNVAYGKPIDTQKI